MYSLARLILILAVATYGYCGIVLAVLYSPTSWYVVVPLVLLFLTRSKTLMNLTSQGSAFWAGQRDLEDAHMIDGKSGRLPLGRLIGPGGRAGLLEAAGALLDWKLKAKKACRQFFAALRGKKTPPLVRMPPATINTVCFAPVGTGKSTALAIPFLLECEDSCIVIDFKGELAACTSLHRRRMGHEIAIFDPYGVIPKQKQLPFKTASLNPLDVIDKRSRVALDHYMAAANAIVVRGEEKDPHWNDCGDHGIAGLIAVTGWYGQGNNRSLQDVDRLATDPKQFAMATQLMQKPDQRTGEYPYDGMLARMGGRMAGWSGEEKSGIISTMARHLSFLRSPAIAGVTRTSSFTPRFKTKKQTAYIVASPEFIRSTSGWIRLMIWALFTSVVKEGLGERRLVHAVLDEAASLEGNFGALEDAVDKYRGYGLRCQFYYQSYGQLKKCWPKDQGTTLLSNTGGKIFMGISDMETANLVSSMLGKSTIIVESGGDNTSGQTNTGETQSGRDASHTRGANRGWTKTINWQQLPRELAKPEELLTLHPRIAVTFPGFGIAPVATRTVRYFEEPTLFTRKSGGLLARFEAACRALIGSLILLAIGLALAAMLTEMATAH